MIEYFAQQIGILYTQYMNNIIDLDTFQIAFNKELDDAKKLEYISDYEIQQKAASVSINTLPEYAFIAGARWYREQLKQRNK